MSQPNLHSPTQAWGWHTQLSSKVSTSVCEDICFSDCPQCPSPGCTSNSYWNTVQNNAKKTKPYFIPKKHLTIRIPCLLSTETSGYTHSSSSTLVLVLLELSTLLSELCTCICTGKQRQTRSPPSNQKQKQSGSTVALKFALRSLQVPIFNPRAITRFLHGLG